MTDNAEYAAAYIKNGGKLVSVKIPSSTIDLMQYNNDLIIKQGLNINFNPHIIYNEYVFSPRVKFGITIKF